MAEANSFATFALAVYPIQNEVLQGTAYGDPVNALVGMLDPGAGTPNYPPEPDVRAGVAYGELGAEQFTGTLDLPAIGDVRSGTVFDGSSKVGLLDLPVVTDVRAGTTFDQNNQTGALDLPSVNNVRLNIIFDSGNQVGTVREAPVDKVELGYQYGANDLLTGQLECSGTGGGDVLLTAPLPPQPLDFEIVQGDSYLLADGREIEFTGSTADQWPDLTGATVRFVGHMDQAMTVVQPTGTQVVRLQFNTSETQVPAQRHKYDIQATLSPSAEVVTLVRGVEVIVPTYSDVPVRP